MIDSDEGLKDRDEVLEEMRSLFRYEDELLKGNWYSETDFVEEVVALAKELLDILTQNE